MSTMEQFNEEDFARFIKRHLGRNRKRSSVILWIQRIMRNIQLIYDPNGGSTSIGCIILSSEEYTAERRIQNEHKYLNMEKMNIVATAIMNDIIHYFTRMDFAEKKNWSRSLIKSLRIPRGQLRRYAYLIEEF